MAISNKLDRKDLISAALLMGVPFMLNACSGNPFNGEKLSLFGSNTKDAPATAPVVAQNQKQKPAPTSAKPPAAPSCVINTKGTLEASDSMLIDFNKEVAALEATLPTAKKFREMLRDSEDIKRMGATPAQLKALAANLLQRSRADADSPPEAAPTPAPAPGPATTTAPGSATLASVAPTPTATPAYPLHPTVVAWVALKYAYNFATSSDSDSLGLSKVDEVKAFTGNMLQHEQIDKAVIGYIKAFRLAINPEGLKLSRDNAQKLVDKIFSYGIGTDAQIALAWVGTYDSDPTDYKFSKVEALNNANAGLCFTLDATDPTKGFTGVLPSSQQTPQQNQLKAGSGPAQTPSQNPAQSPGQPSTTLAPTRALKGAQGK